MDEILIEEKKYVSSKQAAKITGYAKDYIGQLCREGRVPARLVGRSWYVLETAIQDHRFGNEESEGEKKAAKTLASEPLSASAPKTWEFPRYEAADTESLPVINRLEEKDDADVSDEERNLQNSWKEWFEHVSNTLSTIEGTIHDAGEDVPLQEVQEEYEEEQEIVSVPVHIRHTLPERDILPVRTREQQVGEYQRRGKEQGQSRAVLSIQIAGAVIAVAAVAVAAIGSGYFDEYMTSVTQATMISGISVYNK